MLNARVDQRLAQHGGCAGLLWLPSMLYRAGASLNGYLYDRGLRQILQVAAPVVSVGNLSAGGTGKTPLVAWLARWFQAHGRRPGIASRGYGSAVQRGSVVQRDSEVQGGAAAQGAASNDEARMLARELTDVPHEQDPDRVAAAQRLVDAGVDVVLMDDGFQHRRLARDLDLVLVDAQRPWGLPAPRSGGTPVRALLPRGLLREPLSALGRADLIVLTRVDTAGAQRLAELEGQLAEHAPDTPVLHALHSPSALVDGAGRDLGLATLAGCEVDLLSGVGNPEAVEATLHALGAHVVTHRARPDHHAWKSADLAGLGSRPVVTTAKDRPKLEQIDSLPAGVRPWTLEVCFAFQRGEDQLTRRLAALPPAQARIERAAFHEGLHG